MNVLIISHTYIAPINRDKWKVLAAQYSDVELTVIIPQRWPTHLFVHEVRDLSDEQRDNISFIALPTFGAGNEVRYVYPFHDLARVISLIRPDIIQVEQGDNALSYLQTIVITKLLGIKAQFCFFTWVNWSPQVSWKYKVTWGIVERINRYFTAGAITGNHDAQVLLGAKAFFKPMEVIPQLGVNKDLFSRPSMPLEQVFSKESLSPLVKTIGFVGRLTHEKGVLFLLKAFFNLVVYYPDWQLLFVGDGAAKQDLLAFISLHNLQNKVVFHEPVPHHNIAQLFHRFEIFVLPSYDTPVWREQFGHVLIEAMAAQVPIVASDAGEIIHVVGDAGLICKQRDVASLQACLEQLMRDESVRKRLGRVGYKRMSEHYTHQKIAQKTYNFWAQLSAL